MRKFALLLVCFLTVISLPLALRSYHEEIKEICKLPLQTIFYQFCGKSSKTAPSYGQQPPTLKYFVKYWPPHCSKLMFQEQLMLETLQYIILVNQWNIVKACLYKDINLIASSS